MKAVLAIVSLVSFTLSAIADEVPTILAEVTVCPKPNNQGLVRSQTIKLYSNDRLQFDTTKGSWKTESEAPTTVVTYKVDSKKQTESLKKGSAWVVNFSETVDGDKAEDPSQMAIYKDKIEENEIETMNVENCAAPEKAQ